MSVLLLIQRIGFVVRTMESKHGKELIRNQNTVKVRNNKK